MPKTLDTAADGVTVKMKVSKLDAARRQLETAVRLYFFDVDPVSTHTLAAAAYGVLRDLNNADGGPPTMHDSLDETIEPDFLPEFRRFLSEAQNFFKHANRDPDAVLDFNVAHTESILLDACWTYDRLAGEKVPLLTTFEIWGALTFGASYIRHDIEPATDAAIRQRYAKLPKREFLDKFLPVAMDPR